MTTIEKLKAAIPHMKEWGQFAAVELCEQAAAELAALQRINDQNAHDFKQLRDALNCDGSDLPQLLSEVEALQKTIAHDKKLMDEIDSERQSALRQNEALQKEVASWKQHAEQSDKELCQLQDALGCPCESRNYFCDCGWRGYNQHKCPKCGNDTHDDGMADAQALCMERIRDFVMAEDENNTLRAQNRELREAFLPISQRLKTQDNRITQNPMFCVQIKVRDVGYDADYCDGKCWWNASEMSCVYEEPKNLDGWIASGYKDRWETVMVAFTEKGCEEYLELNGHNDRRRAHNGEVRIYVESFNRCPEMILIREMIKALATQPEKTDDHA